MRYSTTTSESPQAVLQRAVERFGQPTWGLDMTVRDDQNVRFESNLGHIAIEATRTSQGDTEVLIETTGFDDEMQEFIHQLPRESWLAATLRRFRSRR